MITGSLNKKMELGNPAFMRTSGLLLCPLSTIIFEQKNRTPSQRRPYKNTKCFLILKLLYVRDDILSTCLLRKFTTVYIRLRCKNLKYG